MQEQINKAGAFLHQQEESKIQKACDDLRKCREEYKKELYNLVKRKARQSKIKLSDYQSKLCEHTDTRIKYSIERTKVIENLMKKYDCHIILHKDNAIFFRVLEFSVVELHLNPDMVIFRLKEPIKQALILLEKMVKEKVVEAMDESFKNIGWKSAN